MGDDRTSFFCFIIGEYMANYRKEQLTKITEQLERGIKDFFTSEHYQEYLNTMSKFHSYSFNNTLLIAMQKPEATFVAGYHAWKDKFERHVKKGEKGIQILVPIKYNKVKEIELTDPVTHKSMLNAEGKPIVEVVEIDIQSYKTATVFDISQTEGKPLPEIIVNELIGAIEDYDSFLQAINKYSPVPIRFSEIEGGAKGYYHSIDKEIVIQSNMSEIQTMKTVIHEVTHALLHDRDYLSEQGIAKDRMTKEVEAESIAYVVCQYFGLDTSDYSFPYIAGWSSSRNLKELSQSMELIRKTANELIDNISKEIDRDKNQLLMESEKGNVSIIEKINKNQREKTTKAYGGIKKKEISL